MSPLQTMLPDALKRSLRAVAAPYLAHLGIVLLISFFMLRPSTLLPRPVAGWALGAPHAWPFNGLDNWDGRWYLRVAEKGYPSMPAGQVAGDAAFFPLYPLSIWGLECVGVAGWVAAPLISNLAFLAALAHMFDLMRLDYGLGRSGRAVWLVALAPVGIFFSAAYSESLFLAFVLASFYAMRRQRFALAAVLAGCACLTRITGVFLLVSLALETWSATRSAARVAGVVLLGTLLAALFPLFLYLRYGDPVAFAHAHSLWGRGEGFPGVPLLQGFGELLPGRWHRDDVARLDLPLMLAAIGALWAAVRQRVRASYLVFGIGIVALLLTNGSVLYGALYSASRASVIAFPVYIALSALRGSAYSVLLATFAALFGLHAGLYLLGVWVN